MLKYVYNYLERNVIMLELHCDNEYYKTTYNRLQFPLTLHDLVYYERQRIKFVGI